MDDEDTILTLHPPSGTGFDRARDVIEDNKTQPGYVPSDRPAASNTESGTPPRDSPPRYRLTFGDGAKTSFGFVAGTSQDCDFVLKNVSQASNHHFAFQFDDKYRLVVRDLDSTYGTSVKYDEDDPGPRIGTTWLIGGCQYVDKTKQVLVRVAQSLEFLVEVPVRDVSSSWYKENVDRFRKGTNASAEALLSGLQIRSLRPTAPQSHMQTASLLGGPPVLSKAVGEGAFGKVTRSWNAQTGELFVTKVPKRVVDVASWAKEIGIMRKLSHVSPEAYPCLVVYH